VADRIQAGAARLDGADFDVAVVGGGIAGVAAAIAAADRGARTLLVEAAEALGGNATGAFVHTICGLYEYADAGPPRAANEGFPMRFAAELTAAGGAGPPERAGRVWVVPTDPPAIESHAARACAARASLTTRVACRLASAELARDPRGASRLAVESELGSASVSAQVVIDASGDGVLAALGGAAGERAPDAERQLPSYIARIAGVPAADLAGFGRLRLSVTLADAARRERLPAGCESVLLRPASKPGEAYLTLNVSRDEVASAAAASPDPEAARRSIERRARAHVEEILLHLRETRAGYEDCGVIAWPRRLGVREGARLAGLAAIDEEHVLSGRRCGGEVARSCWPIELWHDHRAARFAHPRGPASVPLGALISRSHPRLGMAGRCISATHAALGALRVLGTALATGEAIGVAAALAASRGCALAEVPARDVNQARGLAGSTGPSVTTTSRAT
jgi:hypothetical protein